VSRTPTPKEARVRKLTLRKDTLTELSTDELTVVVGGQASIVICLTDPCITPPQTGIWCLTRQPACFEA
jgi:hypothetical protein